MLIFFSSSYSKVIVAKWSDAVTPVMADYIKRVVQKAEKENASVIVLELDTPGGLDTAMRDIIKTIMGTHIPFVVFVYPPGARAASAGAIITISADIAVMAPSTNIGSASPVQMGGKDIDETMKKKIVNDMVAYVKSIAKQKGRNVDVIVKMVTESINLPAEEALKKKVIDLIANDIYDLLQKIDGKKIKKGSYQITIKTKDQSIEYTNPGFREKFLSIIANPTLAYLLLMIGFYGIFFELYNPGAIIPGTIGAISLLLALYALNAISVNWLGVLLIALGILFFALEMITPTFGALAISGVISMLIGSITLINPDSPYGDISLQVIVPVVAVSTAFFLTVAYLGLKAQTRKKLTGKEGMIGKIAVAQTDIDQNGGKVFIEGEIWNAYSKEPIKKGEKVKIVKVEGLTLEVEKVVENKV
ncbi:MAG: nodulation protein NfeD [Aquificae bacterium]|nr:nodulation protein NfeD [Aquificota bacterium]